MTRTSNTEIYLYNHNFHKHADFNVVMAFPGPKSFALSSLGYLWVYKTIDELPDVNAIAVYQDTTNSEIYKKKINLFGFSFSFDMDFYNIFSIMQKYNYPLKSCDRDDACPIFFAGGPVVSANPMPYKDFFDFFVIGDGEDINLQAIEICKKNQHKPKDEILKLLTEIDGIYVPKFSDKKIKKVTKKSLNCIYTPIISNDSFFKNTFIIEIERGCANCCGFCLASYLNLPIRFVPYDEIIKTIDLGLKYTNKIALLGAQITAHPKFKDICEYIYKKIQSGQKISLSISSMRVASFCPEIVKTLVAAGQKNVTLAIEAGSERLRKVINKHLSEEQIFKAVEIAAQNGLKGIKFYGMIGLPTETDEDIKEIINLAKRIKTKYKYFDISFGFSSFVPKPHTPFQWFGREATKTLEAKATFLKKELHKIGVTAQISSIKWDYYQAVLSRGDESFTQYLIDIYKTDIKIGSFKQAAKKNNLDTDFYATKNINFDDKLAWDMLEITPGKKHLKNECKRLLHQDF